MQVSQKVIVVTGAGSGIGRELALQLVNLGARVAGVDLREESLLETANLIKKPESFASFVVDISNRTQVENLPAQVIARFGAVDGIINNAGLIQPFVRLNDLDYGAIERVINVNFYGTVYMVKSFLPHLLLRPDAHIINISSMGGFLPVPGQTLYGASKAAVKLLTEGLRSELAQTRVKVTVVFPGAIETNITKNSGVGQPSISENGGKQAKPSIKMTTAPRAAATIIEGIQNDQDRVLIGNDAKLMDFLYRLSPKRAADFIAKQMRELLR